DCPSAKLHFGHRSPICLDLWPDFQTLGSAHLGPNAATASSPHRSDGGGPAALAASSRAFRCSKPLSIKEIIMSSSVVLITGALTGIGRAAALSFAKAGHRGVVSGRKADAGRALVGELRSLGAEAEFV